MRELLENLYQEEIYSIPRSRLAVFLPKPWNELREEDIVLLSKILGAIKLSLSAVRIITLPIIDLHDPKLTNTADTLLIFGCKTKFPVDFYSMQKIQDFNVILSNELHELDDTKKKSLWQTLKHIK